MKALERTIEAWAKEYLASLDAKTRKLISQANFDLYYGPVADGAVGDPATDDPEEWQGYPGFVSATRAIREALDDVPSTLYVDTDAECWFESEPGPDECGECSGQGEVRDLEAEDPDDDMRECPMCDGSGKVAPFLGSTYRVERRDLVRALLGSELAASL